MNAPSTIKFNTKYLKNFPYVYFNIHKEPIKNGPHVKGYTQVNFGENTWYHSHHFRFLAIKLNIWTTKDINIPAGKKRFIDSFPSKGADNQGITKINSAIDFEYFFIFIL